MRRLIIIVALAFVAIGGWFFFKPRIAPPLTSIPASAVETVRQTQEAALRGNGSAANSAAQVSVATSVASFSTFSMPGATNVTVEISTSDNGQQSVTAINLTLQSEEPSLLARTAYEKIKAGMKYAEVGEILGGQMTKGQMADGFSGSFNVMQGKRKIVLNFREGVVEKKSAQGLD